MKIISPLAYLVNFIVLCSFATSCHGGVAGFGPPIPNERDVQLGIDTVADWGQGESEGVTKAFTVIVSGGEKDKDVLSQDLAIKVEIDPGDGSGWLDFTQGYFNPANPTYHIGTHVYSEPGTYTLRTRVTYWNGDVFLDDGLGQRTITISPAGE